MSIFGIIGISFLISMLIVCVFGLISTMPYDENWTLFIIGVIVSFVIFIACIFGGIGLNTEEAKVWSAKFEAQKTTIEQSLDSEVLSGLERIQLVNQAAELNGELASRKTRSELWHYVYYDNSVYDGLEPICISGKEN